jgi:hypothetical protein
MHTDEIIIPLKETRIAASGKHTLIILQKDDYQNEVAQKTLGGIAKALGLNFENDIELFLFDKENPTNIASSLGNFKKVLIFGVNPKAIGLQMDAKIYKIFSFEAFSLLVAHPVTKIAEDIKTKQILWKILQTMYGLV